MHQTVTHADPAAPAGHDLDHAPAPARPPARRARSQVRTGARKVDSSTGNSPSRSRSAPRRRPWALVCTLFALALALPLAPARAADADIQEVDRYYVINTGGEKAGWMRETVEILADGNILTSSHMEMKIDRMGTPVELTMKTTFLEDARGEAIEMTAAQNFGGQAIATRYEFREDGVVQTVEQMGRELTSRAPLPAGEWFTPGEARQFVAKRLRAGAQEISYRVLDPSSGLTPISNQHRVIGETTTRVLGKAVPAIEWEIATSAVQGLTTREFVDENGDALRYSITTGGIDMEIVAADERFAKAEFDAPELMSRTFVSTDAPIKDARTSRKASYIVRIDEGTMPEFLNAGVQRVERIDDQTLRVRVDLARPAAAQVGDEERAELLTPSAYIDSDDPRIIELARRALREAGLDRGASDGDKARAFELFVHNYVEYKLLGVGFATASEVCRTRQGDCTEHGVLLAALCRTQGIPSRVITGLVYVNEFEGATDIFAYHMWTQALLEDTTGVERWVDLDAAIYPMDATHIAIDASALAASDPVGAMIGTVQILGQLRVEVESVD